MKIIHTGDLHLYDYEDERWEALESVISVCQGTNADILVISGDLFYSDADADALRVSLRSVFDKAEFDTLIIPGNHDADSYAAGLLFGDRVHILANTDWSKNVFETEDSRFIGVPFEAIDSQEFHQRLRGLRDLIDPDRVNILLYHGELLDASFDRGAFGPEESGRYMPSRLAFFDDLSFDYVLAGHFHTTFDVRRFGDKGFFVYPGSPVSVTRREVGKRKVALIEPRQDPKAIELNTHHYERIDLTFNAFDPVDPSALIDQKLKKIDPAATILLTLSGTIRGSEKDLAEAVRTRSAKVKIELDFKFRDVSRFIKHPAFELFKERLHALAQEDATKISEDRVESLRKMVIQAMTEAEL